MVFNVGLTISRNRPMGYKLGLCLVSFDEEFNETTLETDFVYESTVHVIVSGAVTLIT